MGASHSRARPGTGPAKTKRFQFGKTHSAPSTGYFILSLKGDRIKVVNAEAGELKLIAAIIRRHCSILRDGWDRHLTFSYKIRRAGKHCMIQLVADALLSLYQLGWEPMTPIDMGITSSKKLLDSGEDIHDGDSNSNGPQTAICFRRRCDHTDDSLYGSNYSLLSHTGSAKETTPVAASENSCLCLETYRDNYLGFHDVSNTILYNLVDTIRQEWRRGIRGVSMAVSSVISDYTPTTFRVLPYSGGSDLQEAKYIQLNGRPWVPDDNNDDEDSEDNDDDGGSGASSAKSTERLQMAIIACLVRERYTLSMTINMDATSRVYFFIRDKEADASRRTEIRMPNMAAGAGLGEKDTLSVYRPILIRSKSSFFRSYHGRSGPSMRRKVISSLRKKVMVRQQPKQEKGGGQDTTTAAVSSTAMTYKPQKAEPAWWQQTSTDVSSDHEDI